MASPNGIATLPRVKPGRRGTLIQLLDIQKALHSDALSGETTASARAQVARAYSELEYLKRVIRGKPNPKPIDVSAKAQPKSRTRQGFTEQDLDNPKTQPKPQPAAQPRAERKPGAEPGAEPQGQTQA